MTLFRLSLVVSTFTYMLESDVILKLMFGFWHYFFEMCTASLSVSTGETLSIKGGHMWYYITKLLISASLIVVISELAKRSSVLGAIVASVPLTSVIAMIWLYHDTADTAKVIALASNIFWLVLPSLVLFISLPILLKHELMLLLKFRHFNCIYSCGVSANARRIALYSRLIFAY